MSDVFGTWWSVFKSQSRDVRLSNYQSLTKTQQTALRQSFLQDGWCELFCQNYIDNVLDYIKDAYSIDLIDLRIKALKYGRVFLIDKHIWNEIEDMIFEYDPLFDSNILFGGLQTEPWGLKNNFFKVYRKEQ